MNLNQVTVPSHDGARSVAFYRTLGLRLIVDSVPRYARFECPDGEATFSIHHVDAPIAGEAPLVAEGIVFDTAPVDQNWLWREAHLRDPDGNRLILFNAGHNRRNPPWRVDPE